MRWARLPTMRRAMDVFPWGVVLKDVVRRDQDTGEARKVRVTVDDTKDFGCCLRHSCVDFDWAPDPNALAHVAPVPPSHLRVWRRGRQTHPGGAYAVSGDRGGYTVRVRHVAIARGRRVAIARGRRRRPGPSWPLGQRVPLPPRRLPSLGRRACATCAFARPVGLLCQRWRMPGSTK